MRYEAEQAQRKGDFVRAGELIHSVIPVSEQVYGLEEEAGSLSVTGCIVMGMWTGSGEACG